MLIAVKNPELYRQWIAYLGENNYANRTHAYFASQRCEAVPLYR